MKSQIICLNPDCSEVPNIRLENSNNTTWISTDCSIHHSKYKLDEYLISLQNQKKEYCETCLEHNEKYIGYSQDTCLNICRKCLNENKNEKIIYFEKLKVGEYNIKQFDDLSLSKLYSIIYQNLKEAEVNDKIVYELFLNYQYMNAYNEKETFSIDEVSYIQKSLNLEKQIEQYKDSPFKTNLKYIIRYNFNKKAIEIFNIEKQDYIFSENIEDSFPQIELSEFYYDIFLTASNYDIKIWKIFEKEKEVKIQTTINLEKNKENFCFAKFSSINEKVILTVSNDLSIKIWNLEKIFYISEIKDIPQKIKNVIFSLNNESIIGLYSNQEFYIYDINHKKAINQIHKNHILYSNFIDSENVLIINSENIEVYNYKENKSKRTINHQYNYNNKYYYKNGLLYILDNYLKIIDLNTNKTKQFSDIKYDKNFDDIILINNKSDDLNYYFFNILILKKKQGLLYSLFIKHQFVENIKNDYKKNSKYFLKNNKQRLYPVSELSFNQIKYNDSEIYMKKYFKNQNIKNELIKNYKIDLAQKKINVENKLINYESKKSLNDEYFQLLSLLIQDNTNKTLIEKYLIFLKENGTQLTKNNIEIETYIDELDYYKVIFEPEEIKIKLQEIKISFEKEEFIKLLESIKDIMAADYNKFKNDINKSKLGRFNQKIDFYKNQELYWFRNKNLMLYAITKLPFEKFENIKYCINQVINRELLKDPNIVENKNRLSIVIINLVTSQTNNAYNYNLNLVSSFDVKSEHEFKILLKKEGFIEKNGKYYLSNNKNIELNPKQDKDICIKNYILNKTEKLNLSNYQLFNYDKIMENFYLKIDITKIKNFLSKFLVSNLFKEIYFYLYPDSLIFPFKQKGSAEKFLNENLYFLPMRNEAAHGSTDKFTLEIYIYIEKKDYNNMPKDFDLNNNDNIFFLTGFMTGELIKTGIHEINHDMYNIYYYHSNGIISLKTPRKTINGFSLRESGREIEILLFGKQVTEINIKQVLYLLNEKNYEKGIIDFKKGFNELKDSDLDIQGEFSDFNKIKNSKYFDNQDDFTISTSASNYLFSMKSISDNDTL